MCNKENIPPVEDAKLDDQDAVRPADPPGLDSSAAGDTNLSNDGREDNETPPAEFFKQYHADKGERFELFLLGPGEKKVTWEHDTRVPNTAIFTFNKEDHTIGNLLASRLHKYRYVSFSGYQTPHPLFASFKLRVSTDGSVTPKDAVITACRDIVQDLETFSREFTKEMELKKIAQAGGDA